MPRLTSIPFILTLPEDLGIREVKILKVVDFPAPFGPKSPKISPLLAAKVLFLMAVNPF